MIAARKLRGVEESQPLQEEEEQLFTSRERLFLKKIPGLKLEHLFKNSVYWLGPQNHEDRPVEIDYRAFITIHDRVNQLLQKSSTLDRIINKISATPQEVIDNPNWAKSIRKGLQAWKQSYGDMPKQIRAELTNQLYGLRDQKRISFESLIERLSEVAKIFDKA